MNSSFYGLGLVALVSSTTYAITQMQLLLGEDTTKEVGKTP